eukprot:6196570-Pleurochrysis_carterae.AAC.2
MREAQPRARHSPPRADRLCACACARARPRRPWCRASARGRSSSTPSTTATLPQELCRLRRKQRDGSVAVRSVDACSCALMAAVHAMPCRCRADAVRSPMRVRMSVCACIPIRGNVRASVERGS